MFGETLGSEQRVGVGHMLRSSQLLFQHFLPNVSNAVLTLIWRYSVWRSFRMFLSLSCTARSLELRLCSWPSSFRISSSYGVIRRGLAYLVNLELNLVGVRIELRDGLLLRAAVIAQPRTFDVVWLALHLGVASEQLLDVGVLLGELVFVKLEIPLLSLAWALPLPLFIPFTA